MYDFGKNICVIAAHPDDEILGVGGTIPLLKKSGARITIVIVTDGSSTQYKGDNQILHQKFDEATEAQKICGADELIHWKFPDMLLDSVPHVELNEAFEKLFTEKKFDCIFIQNESDINLDHIILHRSAMVAARPHPMQTIKNIVSYYVNSSTEWGGRTQEKIFCPNLYVNIEETIGIKLEAMRAYKSELRDYPHPRSLQALETAAAYFGNQVGYAFAEPFKLVLSR